MYIDFFNKVLKTFLLTRHLTFKKLKNLLKNIGAQYLHRDCTLFFHPAKLIVDPASRCMLHCPLCPTGQDKTGRSKGFMNLDKFKIIIDENYEYLFEIDLFNWGEPLLNKDIIEMISYAQERNIGVTISSNLNDISDNMAEKIVNSGLERLIVSIDGATESTYSIYRKGGNFGTVLINAQKIINAKKQMHSKYPVIIWQYIAFRHNEHEIKNARALAYKMGFDKFMLRHMRSDMGRELFISDKMRVEESGQWLPSQDSLSRFFYIKKMKRIRPSSCLFLWTHGVINWNGSVSPCCAVYQEQMDLGNAFVENSFLKVWNNYKFQDVRRMVKKKTADSNYVCSNCIKHGFIEY